MENHMGESVFLDELVKGPVDDLTFHRASVTGAEHKIVVDVFITEQVFQLVNFGFSVHQHFSNRLGKVDPPNTGLGLWFFQNKCCMGACDTRRKLFDYPFIAEIIQRPTSDTLQFLVDENAGITSINAVRRYIDTMILFAQLKELRNSVYKVAVWSRAAVLLNITEIAILLSRILSTFRSCYIQWN